MSCVPDRRTSLQMGRNQMSALLHSMQSIVNYYLKLINWILLVEDKGNSTEQESSELCVSWYVEWLNSKRHAIDINYQMIFERLADHFSKAHTQEIALSMMEFISLFSVRINSNCRSQAIALSWTGLHTLYTTSAALVGKSHVPFSFSKAIHSTANTRISMEMDQHFPYAEMETKSEIVQLQQGLLRHWGLICIQPIDFVKLECDFGLLIADFTHLLDNMLADNSATIIDRRKKRKRNQHFKISVVGLSEDTFSLFYEWLIKLVTLTCGITSIPSVEINKISQLGPYSHLEIIFKLFQRLCNTYQTYFAIFPKSSAALFCTSTNDMMTDVINLLHRCIEWRTQQPILPPENRKNGSPDVGSVIYLKNLFDSVTTLVITPILSIAGKWQESGYQFSKYSRLRKCAQRAQRALQKLCQLHVTTTVDDTTMNGIVNDSKAAPIPLLTESLKMGNYPGDITKAIDSDDSDTSSFGIDGGGWGDASDESNVSLGLQ
jgi:hypothetical protein